MVYIKLIATHLLYFILTIGWISAAVAWWKGGMKIPRWVHGVSAASTGVGVLLAAGGVLLWQADAGILVRLLTVPLVVPYVMWILAGFPGPSS